MVAIADVAHEVAIASVACGCASQGPRCCCMETQPGRKAAVRIRGWARPRRLHRRGSRPRAPGRSKEGRPVTSHRMRRRRLSPCLLDSVGGRVDNGAWLGESEPRAAPVRQVSNHQRSHPLLLIPTCQQCNHCVTSGRPIRYAGVVTRHTRGPVDSDLLDPLSLPCAFPTDQPTSASATRTLPGRSPSAEAGSLRLKSEDRPNPAAGGRDA